MKKYLLYNNLVRGAGIGHTLMCYNHAVQESKNKDMQLLLPPCVMGHRLGNNFEFEKFFGLPQYDIKYLDDLVLHSPQDVEIVDFNGGCFQNSDFSSTKLFFFNRFAETMMDKNKMYKSHLVENKKNIAIHIRRGDIVTPKYLEIFKNNSLKIVHDEWFKYALDSVLVKEECDMSDVNINIYTELQNDGMYHNGHGEVFDLKTLFGVSNCSFYYDGNMWEVLYNMITSDIFIGATLGVPMTVALFRDGLGKITYVGKQNTGYIKTNSFSHVQIIG